jgi:hypothetical protein
MGLFTLGRCLDGLGLSMSVEDVETAMSAGSGRKGKYGRARTAARLANDKSVKVVVTVALIQILP